MQIKIDHPIYTSALSFYKVPDPWIMPGRYEIIREFDKDRYLIRLGAKSTTLVKKSLTQTFA